MKEKNYILYSLLRRPVRSVSLILLTAFLSFSVFAGSVISVSLESGLKSLGARMGADIIVLPSSAESKTSFKNLLLQGTTGAFYMSGDTLERVKEVEGIEVATPQTFLASLKADCCSVKIQVIGIDPDTDFIMKPWIDESCSQELGDMEVAVGCRVTADVNETLRIYDENCRVIAKLAETGTGLDTAVYCTLSTMNRLLRAAEEKGVTHKITTEGEEMISAVYVRVKDGADIEQVNSRINGHVRKVTAVRMRSMLTGVSDTLSGVSHTITLLIGAVWILALVILLIAYSMMIHERKREFAVLRVAGASRRTMRSIILKEAALCGAAGGALGVIIAATCVFSFTKLIETKLGLPYLSPDAGRVILFALATLLISSLVSALASVWAAGKLSKTDPGIALREGG